MGFLTFLTQGNKWLIFKNVLSVAILFLIFGHLQTQFEVIVISILVFIYTNLKSSYDSQFYILTEVASRNAPDSTNRNLAAELQEAINGFFHGIMNLIALWNLIQILWF